jgi:hypothetical protein
MYRRYLEAPRFDLACGFHRYARDGIEEGLELALELVLDSERVLDTGRKLWTGEGSEIGQKPVPEYRFQESSTLRLVRGDEGLSVLH